MAKSKTTYLRRNIHAAYHPVTDRVVLTTIRRRKGVETTNVVSLGPKFRRELAEFIESAKAHCLNRFSGGSK